MANRAHTQGMAQPPRIDSNNLTLGHPALAFREVGMTSHFLAWRIRLPPCLFGWKQALRGTVDERLPSASLRASFRAA